MIWRKGDGGDRVHPTVRGANPGVFAIRSSQIGDISLRQDIIDVLDFALIGVGVGKGVVTLGGHVSGYAQKLAAEKTVKREKGITAIASIRRP